MASLGVGSERIMRAFVDAARPRGSGFDQEIDEDVIREMDAFLPYLPPLLRRLLPLGLRLLEWGPALFARPRRAGRMSRLPTEERLAYLEGWLEAGGLRGALLLGLRTLVFMAFYQHPQVLDSLGVDWQGRAERLTHERAALLLKALP
jgi:hypothetical protein